MCFLWIEWTDFTIILTQVFFFTSLLVVYLVNFLKNSPFKRVFVFFFYLHAREQGKTRSSCRRQSTFPPWSRGKGNCLQNCPHRLTLVLDGSRTGQVQLRLDWSVLDPPKTQVKAGCGVQENTRQYREAREGNLNCPTFLTNI